MGVFEVEGKIDQVKYLAYVEQIPKKKKIHLVALGKGHIEKIRWALQLFKDRNYEISSLILRDPVDVSSFCALPVVEMSSVLGNTTEEDVFILMNAEPDSTELTEQFCNYIHVYDATHLYFFVHCSCKDDTINVLIDDLSVYSGGVTAQDCMKYGKIWRDTKRFTVAEYVRNIEKNHGVGSKFVVNLGLHDGITGDPCYSLLKDGWGGWGVDGADPSSPVAIEGVKNLEFPNFKAVYGQYINPENIVDNLEKNAVPYDSDVVKIDIDSYDGPVIEKILEGGYLPRVFCIEVNPCFPPPYKFAVKYETTGYIDYADYEVTGLYGCSVAWAASLFEKFGYTFARYEFGFPLLIGGIRDMIFIRNDVLKSSEATLGISYVDAFYAEPLGWSHIKSGLGLDPRTWRHSISPEKKVKQIRKSIKASSLNWESLKPSVQNNNKFKQFFKIKRRFPSFSLEV